MAVEFSAFQGPKHRAFYWENGPDAALLVHGFPGTPAEMRAVGQDLYDMGLSVQGLLLPGFGSDFPTLAERHHTEWAATVERSLAALQRKHRRVILVGNSMGAALVLRVAARRSVDGVVLFAPFWRVDTWLDKMFPVAQRLIPRIRPFAIARFDDPKFRDGLRDFFPDADLDDPAVQKAVRKISLPTRVLAQVRRSGQLGYRSADRVEAPVLIFQGCDDPLVRPQVTKQLASRLPNLSALIEVPGAHEIVQRKNEHWSQITVALNEFVVDVAADPRDRAEAERTQGAIQ